MCGIFGIVGNVSDFSWSDVLAHRGPDDVGVWSQSNVMLGHRRLSIQDLSSFGHQPMLSDDGRYVLIFNGEIYNHLDLRRQLNRDPLDFKSSSDTETLLYWLIEKGADFICRLNGIFSFAFYDTTTRVLIVCRDQFGVKPLYYSSVGKAFAFASELKALLPMLDDFELDGDRLVDYISLLWCPGEGTPTKDIKKLLPGHYLIGTIAESPQLHYEVVQYYKVPFQGCYSKASEKELVDLLDIKLNEAVGRQLLSDVPVGFFLSGGLDSSLVVAIARKTTGKKLQCFTIDAKVDSSEEGFENDLSYARNVASHLDVQLEVVKADVDIVRDFDFMIWHLDEPQADAAPLNVSNISRRAKEMGFKVLLGGTAGDDIFSGYRRHQAVQLEQYISAVPSWILKPFSWVQIRSKNAFIRRLSKVLNELGREQEERLSNYFIWLSKDRVRPLLRPELRGSLQYDPSSYFLNLLKEIPEEKSWLNRMLYWEMRSFLVDHNLNYTDKMGMAHGVEIRVPYLDVDLVEFACHIPPDLKLKGSETKYILKKVAERYLPKEVIYRSKTGFGAPVRDWILNDLHDVIHQRLLTPSPYNSVFDLVEVQKLIDDNEIGKIDASYSIWSLLAIESWIRQFLFSKK